MKKMQKARVEALEAALGAVAKSVKESDSAKVDVPPEEVLAYAKFILGKRPEKKDALDVMGMEEPSSPVGEDPGDRRILTQWAEAIRSRNAEQEAALEREKLEGDTVDPEEEQFATSRAVTWAPQRHAPETSEKAPDHVVTQGASLGCPECSAELKRRQKRDDALGRGRAKLAGRRRDGWAGGPLDEDELLAVAGSELYPPYAKEPPRDLKIRNRKGEVRTYVQRSGASGWTAMPGNPWALHYAWTSLEISRRGPWHVV